MQNCVNKKNTKQNETHTQIQGHSYLYYLIKIIVMHIIYQSISKVYFFLYYKYFQITKDIFY